MQFYIDLYTYNPVSNVTECLQTVPHVVTEDMNVALLAPISNAEIEKAAKRPQGQMDSMACSTKRTRT